MTTLTEGNLRITFPRGTRARKFDEPETHGLSCMKAVDFIVEETDRMLFMEFKDPDDPHATEARRERFIERFSSGGLDADLKYKYRDTFLYQWASDEIDKPIHYWVLVAAKNLTTLDLTRRTDALRRELPLDGPRSGGWRRPIVTDCMVFNLHTWNKYLQHYPVERV